MVKGGRQGGEKRSAQALPRVDADGPPEVVLTSGSQNIADGSVLNGKFRVLGPCHAQGDELAYKAMHLGTGRRVELRVLPDGVSASGPEAERMLRAARAAGRAPHANVLNVVDSGLDREGRPFVVYEQFAGVSCSELLRESGPCELHVAADILSQVLDALSALHARGIHHRQLRPENVLVERGDDELRVKVMGLGFSAQPGRDGEIPELPRGYSRYLAPEARRGEATSSAAIDIYAAGILMRFLLTGDPALEGELPVAVEHALVRATADDPDERYASTEQFRACLSALAGPSTRESLLPSGSLPSDLRFLLQRREALNEAGAELPSAEEARIELYPVLLIIEGLYARIGAEGWRELLKELPELEQLLPAAGKSQHYRARGVSGALVTAMLQRADQLGERGNLRIVGELADAIVKRGIRRFCPALPAQLTAEGFVSCIPVLWRSLARDGEVVSLEQRAGSARLAVRTQLGPSLERSALFAALVRAELSTLSLEGEVNLIAVQALGDGADVLVLSW